VELQAGVAPPTTAADPRRMRWRGSYSATVGYAANDVVLHTDGRQYVALQAATGQDPSTATAYWQASSSTGDGGPSIHGTWRMDPATTASDPGSGDVRFNNATPASVTAVYIHEFNRAGSDTSNVFEFIGSGTQMLFQQRLDASRFLRVQVNAAPTDNGAWWTLPVTILDSGLLPQTNTDVSIVLFIGGGGGAVAAEDVSYDSSTSELVATDVQAAIDELDSRLDGLAATNDGALHNSATSAAGPGFSSDTYLTGSGITIPSSILQAGSRYRLEVAVTKTGVGTAAAVLTVRFGTNGSTSDAALLTFTLPSATANADGGILELSAVFRSVGSGTSAILHGWLRITHDGTNIGIMNVTQVRHIQVTSSGFNSTTSGAILGASLNAGASASWTVYMVNATLENVAIP
jgi:hypothetical protein